MRTRSGTRSGPGGTVRASVVAPLVAMLDRRSGKADLVLAAQGLRREEFSDPYGRIPLARYVALFEAVAHLLGDPQLGLRLGAAARPADLGPLGVLFAACPTLRGGLTALARSLAALQSGTLMRLEETGDTGCLVYAIEDPGIRPRVQDSDFTLSATTELCRHLSGRAWRPLAVHFDHARPADLAAYQRVFRCPLVFDMPEARLVVSRRDLDAPRQPGDEGLLAILRRHVDDLVAQNAVETTLPERVRALVRSRLPVERVAAARVARDLGTSTRTLQRALHEEGTSLRRITREERCAFAMSRLRTPDSSEAIAAAMGYADGTVFWRAFKKWTGRSPSSFRRSATAAP